MSKTAKIDVILNGEPAKAALADMKNELKQMMVIRDKAFSSGDVNAFLQADKNVKNLSKNVNKLERDVFDVDKVLKNLSGASIRDIEKALSQANRELKLMKRNTHEWDEQRKKVALLRNEIDKTGKTGSLSFSDLKMKFIAWSAAIMGVVYAFGKLYKAAEEQEVADRRLFFAAKNNIDTFQQLKKQADELQQATGIDDASINQIQMLGVTSGKSVEQVKKLVEASVELSSITGDDLQTSYMQLNNTYNGILGKTLPKLSTDFKELSKEQLKNGEAIDLVLQKYKGTAQQTASATAMLSSAWGEFGETVGSSMGPVGSFLKMLAKLLVDLKSAYELLFQFNGNRDAWELSKKGVEQTADSVNRFRQEMLEAQKDEKRWNDIKKEGVNRLNQQLASQQKLYDATKQQLQIEMIRAGKNANNPFYSKDDLRALEEKLVMEQTNINTIKSKISVLNELTSGYSSLDDEMDNNNKSLGGSKHATEVLTDAFSDLNKQISEYDRLINNAAAAGDSALVKQLLTEKDAIEKTLAAAKDLIEMVKHGINPEDYKKWVQAKVEHVTSKPFDIKKAEQENLKNAGNKFKGSGTETGVIGPSEQVQQDEEQAAKVREQLKESSISTAETVNNTILDIIKSRYDAELELGLRNNEKLRDSELSNKKLTASQIAAINEKYDEKARKLKTDAFKKQRDASAIQAGINGALAVTKILADVPKADFGIATGIMIAAAVATTASEIAAIYAAPVPEYYTGGYTQSNYNDNKPVGTVHANEFVGNAQAVRNPTIKPVFDIIDYAQRNGTINSINLPAVISATAQFKSGGYGTPQGNSTVTPVPVYSKDDMETLKAFITVMQDVANNGVKGKWDLYSLENIQEKKAIIEKSVGL